MRISWYTSLMLSDDICSVDGVAGSLGRFWHLQWATGVLLDLGVHSFADLGFVVLAVLVMKIFTFHGGLGCACVLWYCGDAPNTPTNNIKAIAIMTYTKLLSQ